MVRTSASQSVDLSSITLTGHINDFTMMEFTAFLLGDQHKMSRVETKPTSSLVVCLENFVTRYLDLHEAEGWHNPAVNSLR